MGQGIYIYIYRLILLYGRKHLSEVAQLCPTLCNPMDCSLPGPSIYGLFQAKILEWVAISFSRGSSQPGIESRSPALQADSLLCEPPGNTWWDSEVQGMYVYLWLIHIVVWQKPIQHCKAVTLQLKIKKEVMCHPQPGAQLPGRVSFDSWGQFP